MATPIDVVAFKCRKICLTEIDEIVRYLPHKKNFDSLSNCRNWVDRAQNLPGPALNICRTLFQISSTSVRFWAESQPNAWRSFFWPIEYLQYSARIHSRRIKKVTSAEHTKPCGMWCRATNNTGRRGDFIIKNIYKDLYWWSRVFKFSIYLLNCLLL